MVSNESMSLSSDATNNTESPSRQMTVVDVYDLASVIGKDFERIIEHHGPDCVAQLMPKVISALELLEAFATRNERENEEILTLQSTVHRLEAEKIQKKEGRQKFETELELIEENYRSEIRQLFDMVQKLQEENKRLSSNLENKVESPSQQALKEEDNIKVMMTLQENAEKQRDTLKILQKEIDVKSQEIDHFQRQVEKLQRTNKELTRKNKIVQNQGRALIEEKVDLISVLQDRDQVISQLHDKLGETEKARKDLEETKAEIPAEVDSEHIPKFTLAELREVLKEKNHLKARVLELEEDLAQLRPTLTPSPKPNEKCEEEELVVYGPINKEPEEKLFPWKYERKDSGVRKFLMTMFRKKDAATKGTGASKRASAPAVSVDDSRLSLDDTRDVRCSTPCSFSSSASSSKTFRLVAVNNAAHIHPDATFIHPNPSDRLFGQNTSPPSYENTGGHFRQNLTKNTQLSKGKVSCAPKASSSISYVNNNSKKKPSFVVRYVHPEIDNTFDSSISQNDLVESTANREEDFSIIELLADKPIEFSLTDN